MSDHAFRKFREYLDLEKILPSIHQIVKYRKTINHRFELIKNEFGFYMNIKNKILSMNLKFDILINDNYEFYDTISEFNFSKNYISVDSLPVANLIER